MIPNEPGEEGKPWSNRQRAVPLRTFSGRVVYSRKKHGFTVKDVKRILESIKGPPEGVPLEPWALELITILRYATISLIQRILFFLPSSVGEALYVFGIQLLDMMFRVNLSEREERYYAVMIIRDMASRSDLDVNIKFTK